MFSGYVNGFYFVFKYKSIYNTWNEFQCNRFVLLTIKLTYSFIIIQKVRINIL